MGFLFRVFDRLSKLHSFFIHSIWHIFYHNKSFVLPQGFTCYDLYHTHFHHLVVVFFFFGCNVYNLWDETNLLLILFIILTVKRYKFIAWNQDNQANWINTLLEFFSWKNGDCKQSRLLLRQKRIFIDVKKE